MPTVFCKQLASALFSGGSVYLPPLAELCLPSTYCVYTTQGLVLIVTLSFNKYHTNWPNNVKETVLSFHKGKIYAKDRLDKVNLLK